MLALMTASPTHCRLYLTFATDAHGGGIERLEASVMAGGPAIACVQIRIQGMAPDHHAELQTAVHRVQARDIAVLIANDAELARALGADGVHLDRASGEAEARAGYAIARAALGAERTVGVSAGVSRHLAMVLGEIGADYVAFEPAAADETGEAAASAAIWWAPLFEVPVVALGVASAAEADRLAAAGVDFVGMTLGEEPADELARHVARIAEAIATAEAVG